jgi:hypothetical protein
MKCERCEQNETIAGNKFCKECKKDVLREMREAGYLQHVTVRKTWKPFEMKEDTLETKYGIDR